METLRKDTDIKKISLFLKIGILGAFIILAGDMIMGWYVKDTGLKGLEGMVSQYLAISDKRMFASSALGLLGVPLAVVGHYGIYRLLKPYTTKYSRMYLLGDLGFLAFGGAGVHVSSIELAFFYKYMNKADPAGAIAYTVKFALYFLLPLYLLLITCWLVMVYAHIRAVTSSLSPFPHRAWVFSMAVGTLIFSLAGLFGNHAIVNALMMGAFSLGNIWSLTGHLLMLKR